MASTRPWYIVGPVYDAAFFLLPPVLALALGIAVAHTPFSERAFTLAGRSLTAESLCIGALIHAHLVAVLVRSHGNPTIFRRHRWRFVVVPVVLWFALRASMTLAAASLVVATFWDVWHSGAQTFGLARIYDRNAGNAPDAGRAMDLWLNQILYAGPIVAGATMLDHFESFDAFGEVGVTALARVPAFMLRTHHLWARGVLAAGAVFVAAYVAAQVRLWRRGHRVSWPRVWLLTSTGLCSVYTWGFNTWGEAFFIMNLFHAVQYLALVWATEGRQLCARVGLRRTGVGLAAFGGLVLTYGLAASLVDTARPGLWAVTMVVSLMHFWYDGFVWSVGRREV
ncbi:MAG: hypothetical protein U0325_35905 [Polyangiales bacterium]